MTEQLATAWRLPLLSQSWRRCVLFVAIIGALSGLATAQDSARAARTPGRRLLRAADLSYLGAFRVPPGKFGDSSFEYGGTALAYNPTNNSLFLVGHDWDQAVAEVSIPEVHKGPLANLTIARVLQPFCKIGPRIPRYGLEDTVKIGGLMVVDQRLIGTLYEYYDGDADAVQSHFTMTSLQLKTADVDGLFQVGDLGGGFVGGYMSRVPEEWQSELGVSCLTGQAGLAVISRTSAGPAIFGFEPRELGAAPAPLSRLLYYPLRNPLSKEDTQNKLFNTTTEIRGVAFPGGTASVLFFGSHGIGPWNYGTGEECNDPYRPSKGPHAAPYVYQVWAYDAGDLLAVKSGREQPWRLRPYSVWTIDLPYPEDSKHLGGAAYDPQSCRLYLSQQLADGALPVLHVFEISPADQAR